MTANFINMPISGEYPEKHFGAATPNCLWVKFSEADYQEWVGSFQRGWGGYGKFIIELEKQNKVFVVAGGESFLIDMKTREQLNKVEISGTKTAIANLEQTIIYFSSGYDLKYVDLKGDVFVLFADYYFDDVKLVEIRNNKLYATYCDYQIQTEPFHFEIDLQTKEVKDSFYDSKSNDYVYKLERKSVLQKLIKKIMR